MTLESIFCFKNLRLGLHSHMNQNVGIYFRTNNSKNKYELKKSDDAMYISFLSRHKNEIFQPLNVYKFELKPINV